MHDPDRLRGAQEGREQVAAGLRRVVDRDRLAGEQERAVEVLLDERLRAEALGELGRLRVARLAALDDARRSRPRRPPTSRTATPASSTRRRRFVRRARFVSCSEASRLSVTNSRSSSFSSKRVVRAPVERGGEAGAAVELALIAPCRVPFGRRLGDVTAQPASFGVLLDPLAQARPLAQQRLVGDLDGALADGDEAAVGQRREHVGHVLVALQVELGERGAAAHRRVALALADQAQHEGAHERLALVGDAGVGALGQPRDGAVNAAGLAVGGQGERVVLPLLPELEQRGGQQRQRARLALDVVDERVGQLRLHPQPHPAGGQLDGAPQLRGLHRPDQHVVCAQQLGEPRVGGEAPVEVGAQRDHDDRATVRIGGRAGKRVGEGGALASERQAVKSSSSWSTARRRRPSAGSASSASARGSFAPDTSTRRSSSSGRSPGRSSRRRQPSLPGRTPPARAGRRPARRTDDLPLPDGPTMPRKPAPTRRATSSATSRSRPKK